MHRQMLHIFLKLTFMDNNKKTNTQLICLSGLGGDSIYDRFDNIYVLNLVAASFRNGMQYLKGEHTRGDERETMIATQIQVTQELCSKIYKIAF